MELLVERISARFPFQEFHLPVTGGSNSSLEHTSYWAIQI